MMKLFHGQVVSRSSNPARRDPHGLWYQKAALGALTCMKETDRWMYTAFPEARVAAEHTAEGNEGTCGLAQGFKNAGLLS
jgi:hypothetical protein